MGEERRPTANYRTERQSGVLYMNETKIAEVHKQHIEKYLKWYLCDIFIPQGIASFISYSSDAGICIATTEKVLRNARVEDFDKIIEKLVQKPQARAVVLFVDEDNTRKLLQATIRANRTGHFLWIGSDSWGAKVHPVRDQEWVAEGAITILPHRNPIQAFDYYYKSLIPKLDVFPCNSSYDANVYENNNRKLINCRNGWFREFWSQHNNCSFDNSLRKCSGLEGIAGYEQEGLVPFVGKLLVLDNS
ncbi:hypothetical protein FQR65_LT11740 [Abscondita terminalis]|nr:hypothetical protein FQR65_LT11740 [Abscondita terminalis]